MKNGLYDLNNHLFDAIERVMSSESNEELELNTKKAKRVNELGRTVIELAQLQLDATKLKAYYGQKNLDIEDGTLLSFNPPKALGVKNA
ncbi:MULTISPECIES: hypothetical protein [unclassified Mannheimia]|uniref:hypothetical protein n=1 Tax=unclassified Mannheimia TaxID=2645054 RepID=UPI00359E59B3